MKRLNSNFCVFLIVLNQLTIFVPMGMNLVALNPCTPAIKEFVNETFQVRYQSPAPENISNLIINLAQAMLVVGCAMSAISIRLWIKFFSRRTSVTIVHVISVLSAILMSPVAYIFNSYESIIIGRWLNGVARGAGFALVPLYVAEITHRKTLGLYQSPLGFLVQFSAALGNVVAHPAVLCSATSWPYALAIPGVFSVIYLFCLPWIPETVVHHINWEKRHGKTEDESHETLKRQSYLLLEKLRFTNGKDLLEEYNNLKSEIAGDQRADKASLWQLVKIGAYRRQLLAVIVVQFSLQATGLQVVMQYTNVIFQQAGVHPDDTTYYTIGTQLLMSLVLLLSSGFLVRFGSKKMLSVGLTIAALALIPLSITTSLHSSIPGIAPLGVAGVALYIVGIAFGPMLTVVAYPSEMTTALTRPNAMWLAGAAFWITAALVTFIFPYSLSAIGGYAYVPFIALSVLSMLYVMIRLPDTKGRSAVEVLKAFGKPEQESLTAEINENAL